MLRLVFGEFFFCFQSEFLELRDRNDVVQMLCVGIRRGGQGGRRVQQKGASDGLPRTQGCERAGDE